MRIKSPIDQENLESITIYRSTVRLRKANRHRLTAYRTAAEAMVLTKILANHDFIGDPITQTAQWGRLTKTNKQLNTTEG